MITINGQKIINYKNRGMCLENLINDANSFYNGNNIALIYKKPTPIKVLEFNQNKNTITKACFLRKSTTDYNGIYKGKYIDFEAKSTQSKTSLPLSNFSDWQLKHFKRVINLGGYAFVIIEFSTLGEFYLLRMNDVLDIKDRNSIPIKYIKEKGKQIFLSLNPIFNYLEALDSFI